MGIEPTKGHHDEDSHQFLGISLNQGHLQRPFPIFDPKDMWSFCERFFGFYENFQKWELQLQNPLGWAKIL